MPTKEEISDAAEDLIAAVDYLKTALDNDKPIYESHWLGSLMVAHGVLLEVADSKDGRKNE